MDLQYIEIPVGALDTASDPTQMPPGGLTIADNCSADTPGAYEHRKGYTALSALGHPITKLLARAAELTAIDGTNFDMYGYQSALSSWALRGPKLSGALTTQENVFVASGTDIVRMSVAVASNGVKVDCWIDSAFKVYVQVRSVSDGSPIGINKQLVDTVAASSIIRAVAAGTDVYVVYSTPSAQTIKACRVDCTTGVAGAFSTLFSGANVDATLAQFDLSALSATDVVLVWKTAGATVRAARITAATHAVNANQQIAAEAPDGPIGCIATVGEFGAAVYHSTAGGGMRACCFNASTMVQTVAPVTVEAVTAPVAVNCGAVRADATNVMLVWDRAASGVTKGYTQFRKFSSAGALGSSFGPIRNVLMVSKPYANGSFFFVNVYLRSSLQETFYTLQLGGASGNNNTWYPMAIHAFRTAYSAASVTNVLSDVASPSAGTFWFNGALGFKTLAAGSANAAVATFGCDYASPLRFRYAEALNLACIPGGVCTAYDGMNICDMNFVAYPEITQATPGAVGAGGMDNGTYSYAAVYESSDTQGNVHRSTPSVAVSATTAAGAGLGKVTLTIDHLALVRIAVIPAGQQGQIAVFRTTAGGTAYRYVGSVAMSATAAAATFVDQAHDSTILSNRVLYTDGGVLAREPPPPSTQLLLHKTRLWGISSADRRVLFYSGELQPGEAPWFSSLQQVRVEQGGDITAIASMDDKLIIYKADRIFKLNGSGANPLGQNSDLSQPQPVNTDAGAIDPRSTLAMSDGTMYRNAKGIQILTRSEESAYIGMPVEAYVDAAANVTAAVLLADAREIRFELDTGKKVVFNYGTRRWTTHSNYAAQTAVDAIVVGGVYYWATAGGNVYRESSSSFLDPASTYAPMTIEWAWQALTGRQGLFRCQKLLLLAERMDPHDLTITTSVNNDTVTAPLVSTLTNATLAGLPREQIRVSLTSQKVQSVRVKVVDAGTGATVTGQGYKLRGLGFMAGAKKGAFDKRMVDAAKV